MMGQQNLLIMALLIGLEYMNYADEIFNYLEHYMKFSGCGGNVMFEIRCLE